MFLSIVLQPRAPCNGYVEPVAAPVSAKPQVPPHATPVTSRKEQDSTPAPVENSSVDPTQNRVSPAPPVAAFNSLNISNTPSREQTPAPEVSRPQPDTTSMIHDNIALRYA